MKWEERGLFPMFLSLNFKNLFNLENEYKSLGSWGGRLGRKKKVRS